MLHHHRENRLAHQAPYRTAIGTTAREPPRRAPHQQQRAEAILCHRRCLGTLAPAAVPAAEDSLTAGVAALSPGSGAPPVGDAAGAGGLDSQHSALADRRAAIQGPGLGLGACAAQGRALRRRQSAVFHAGKWLARPAGGGSIIGAGKRASLTGILAGCLNCECGGIGRRARLRIWWGNPCEFESRLSHQRKILSQELNS
jgi:hypothetical protein